MNDSQFLLSAFYTHCGILAQIQNNIGNPSCCLRARHEIFASMFSEIEIAAMTETIPIALHSASDNVNKTGWI